MPPCGVVKAKPRTAARYIARHAIRGRTGRPRSRRSPGRRDGVEVGIGDDAAVSRRRPRRCRRTCSSTASTSTAARMSPRRDRRTARPRRTCPTWRRWAPSRSACWPPSASPPDFGDVGRAGGRASPTHGVPLAGGDLSRAAALVVSVTARRPGRAAGAALGRPPRRPARRDRDAGRLRRRPATRRAVDAAAAPRAGRWPAIATAMIDLSDGIATDVAPAGARLGLRRPVVELERLPRAAGATRRAGGGRRRGLRAAGRGAGRRGVARRR